MENAASQPMTKSAFAALIGVSPGRVSQYISEGKLYGDALAGEGRSARIVPDVARAQLAKTLDPAQRLGGNGAVIRNITQSPPADQRPPAKLEPVHDELAAERLKQQRIKTAQAEREEALAAGRYMLTEDARREMGRAVSEAFKVMEQGIREMANAIAAELGVNQRDAHQVMTKAFREARARAASGFRAEAEASPAMVPDAGDGEDWKAAS